MNSAATPLEQALLGLFHSLHGHAGFPPPSDVSVVARENTGAGRYVTLRSAAGAAMPDGVYDMGGKFIETKGIPQGLMAIVWVRHGAPDEIEIAVYGGDHWDGTEREWVFR